MIKKGDKIKGFKFNTTAKLMFNDKMYDYIGKIGVVERVYINEKLIIVKFLDRTWSYPLNHPKVKKISNLKLKLK